MPAPVDLDPDQDQFQLASEIAALTHSHPTGYLASGALAVIIHRLGHGDRLEQAIDTAVKRLLREDRHQETLHAIQAARRAPRHQPTPEIVETLGAGWIAEEALGISIYCALAFADEPDPEARMRRSLLLAVNHSGDSDSTGAITGNILGALLGASAVPQDLLRDLELREVIDTLAVDLATEIYRTGDCPSWWSERYPGW